MRSSKFYKSHRTEQNPKHLLNAPDNAIEQRRSDDDDCPFPAGKRQPTRIKTTLASFG
jgi:hypothetical protein